jgi:hypothetical protein
MLCLERKTKQKNEALSSFPAVLGLTFRGEKGELILLGSHPFACGGQLARSLLPS